MAIPAIGTTTCPHCDYPGAEVKETKKGLAMIYCDACDQQTFARSKKSDSKIREKMKPLSQANAPDPAPTPAPVKEKSFLESL